MQQFRLAFLKEAVKGGAKLVVFCPVPGDPLERRMATRRSWTASLSGALCRVSSCFRTRSIQ